MLSNPIFKIQKQMDMLMWCHLKINIIKIESCAKRLIFVWGIHLKSPLHPISSFKYNFHYLDFWNSITLLSKGVHFVKDPFNYINKKLLILKIFFALKNY
jgi:hypothetical protein